MAMLVEHGADVSLPFDAFARQAFLKARGLLGHVAEVSEDKGSRKDSSSHGRHATEDYWKRDEWEQADGLPNARTVGEALLGLAVQNEFYDDVKLLIRHGADPGLAEVKRVREITSVQRPLGLALSRRAWQTRMRSARWC